MAPLPWGILASSGGGLTVTATNATLTSDATYYYLTYTNSTSTAGTTTGTLTVDGGQVPMDYLIVAGGGGTSGRELQGTELIRWNYSYHTAVGAYSESECYYYAGGGQYFYDPYSYTCYFNYYADNEVTMSIWNNAGGGGAGGVLTGSSTLNPGGYNISVGAGGSSYGTTAPKATRGISTSAFGLTATGGGAASVAGDQRNGGSGAAGGTGISGQGYSGAPAGGRNTNTDTIQGRGWSCYTLASNGYLNTYAANNCYQGFGTGGSAVAAGVGHGQMTGKATVLTGQTLATNLTMGGLTALGLTVGFGGDSIEYPRNAAQTPATWANTGAGAGYASANQAAAGVVRVRIAKSTMAEVKVAA